jgi:hypothetical protein
MPFWMLDNPNLTALYVIFVFYTTQITKNLFLAQQSKNILIFNTEFDLNISLLALTYCLLAPISGLLAVLKFYLL